MQQPLSVADAARKYREEKAEKEKNGAQPKTVYTNEGILPKGGANALGIAPIANPVQPAGGAAAQRASGSESGPGYADAVLRLNEAWAQTDAIALVDRETLVSTILNGNNSDFPGKAQWEARLMAGRDYYVSHSRQLIVAMRQLMGEAKKLEDAAPDLPESDPRVQTVMNKVKALSRDAQKSADDFKRLVEEGKELAKQAQARRN